MEVMVDSHQARLAANVPDCRGSAHCRGLRVRELAGLPMTRPLPDKAEVALEYPDKLYIGTFEHSSRFDAHLDATGLSLTLERTGDSDTRKTVHLHLNYGLFAEILNEVAGTIAKIPAEDVAHREALGKSAAALHKALTFGKKH
jgi:hypothetical protein